MSYTDLLAHPMASLLPKTTAGACVPSSPWLSDHVSPNGRHWHRTCHYSCHGGAICGAWTGPYNW